MIDDSMYILFNRGAEKHLEPLDDPISARPAFSIGSIFGIDDADDPDILSAPPVYQAMKHALQEARRREAKARSQGKRK